MTRPHEKLQELGDWEEVKRRAKIRKAEWRTKRLRQIEHRAGVLTITAQLRDDATVARCYLLANPERFVDWYLTTGKTRFYHGPTTTVGYAQSLDDVAAMLRAERP